MTRALVIKTIGDADMVAPVANAMMHQTVMYVGERAIIHGEFEKLRERLTPPYRRRKGKRMTRAERIRRYTTKRHGRAYKIALTAWAMFWYVLHTLCQKARRQERWE